MRKGAGTAIAPMLLRLALGVTFLWAGIGKLEGTMTVRGERAVLLAEMGVRKVRDAAPPGPTTAPAPKTDPAPAAESPPPTPLEPSSSPAAPANPAPTSQPAQDPAEPSPPPPQPAPAPQQPSNSGGHLALAQVTAPSQSDGAGQPPADRTFKPEEFPDEITLPRVYGLAFLIHAAANPRGNAENTTPMKLWPKRLARGAWPVRLAWTVALTEIIAGLFVLVGLLTRISALSLAGVMLGALWLSEIGPAVASGKTLLGFIPDRPLFEVEPWRALLWQFALLMMSVALALLGSGAIAFDRKLFPPPPPAPPRPRPMV